MSGPLDEARLRRLIEVGGHGSAELDLDALLDRVLDLAERSERRREELERAVAGLEATVAIARAVGGETDLSRVLELMVRRARALVEARALVILLRDERELVVAATAGELRSGVRGMRIPAAGTVADRVIHVGHAERIDDVPGRMAPVSRRLGFRATAALVAPLTFRGRPLGVLQAYDRTVGGPDFTAQDARLLESFAASAAIAVATAQSVERDRLERSIEASEQERRRWARELHDETLQGMGALRLALATALRSDDRALRQGVAHAIDQLDVDIESLRALVTELRPVVLDDLGLGAALESLVERTAAREDLRVDLSVELSWEPGVGAARLAADVEETIYRLVQEALHNAVRHADAPTVEVRVAEDADAVRMTVSDDGRGFDADAPPGGFGLLGMRERVDLVEGELEVTSAPGRGTVVAATVPLRRGRGRGRRRCGRRLGIEPRSCGALRRAGCPTTGERSLYAPSLYAPSLYAPSIYAPSLYASLYAPSLYAPPLYAPPLYARSIYARPSHAPGLWSVRPTVAARSGVSRGRESRGCWLSRRHGAGCAAAPPRPCRPLSRFCRGLCRASAAPTVRRRATCRAV